MLSETRKNLLHYFYLLPAISVTGEPFEKCLGVLLFISVYFNFWIVLTIWMIVMFIRLIFLYLTLAATFIILIASLCDLVRIRITVRDEEQPVSSTVIFCVFLLLLIYVLVESLALFIVHTYFNTHYKE